MKKKLDYKCVGKKERLGKAKFFLSLIIFLCLQTFAFAQGVAVKGHITTDAGVPLPSVTVIEKGTTNGAISDLDGNYAITVKKGSVLVFSMIGFTSNEKTVPGAGELNVVLVENVESLDEVVVVGYGSQSRATLTTSISKLDEKVLENVPFANAASSLQGALSGVRVQTVSGQPGATPRIILRGGTSINNPNGATPLYIIDGILRDNMSDLNSSDIESIQVLKDAAATAIYGSRASNGVVIVTTKTGKGAGKPKISYSMTAGVATLGKSYDMVSAEDYIYYGRLGIAATGEKHPERLSRLNMPIGAGVGNNIENNTGFTTQYLQPGYNDHKLNEGWSSMVDPLDPSKTIIFKNTDWTDKLFRTAVTTNHHLSFSGSTEKANYDLSVGYLNSQGVAIKTGYERITAKMSGRYKIRDNFSVHGLVNYSSSSDNTVYSTNQLFQRAIGLPPTAKFEFEDGTLAPGQNRSIGNPVYHLGRKSLDNRDYKLSLAIGADWEIAPKLTFSPFVSYFQEQVLNNAFQRSYNNNATQFNDSRNASADFRQNIKTQYEGVFTYSNVFKDDHTLNVKAGASNYSREYYSLDADGRGASTDLITTLNASAEPTKVSSAFTDLNIIGFFGRLTYDYKKKYLFSASIRTDGASNLGENNKWGIFPGISAGWNMHNEKFWEALPNAFSKFKLRTSYGVTGNLGDLSDFHAQGQYSVGSKYNGVAAVQNSRLANQDLKWEESATIGFGFDLGLFKNRVNVLFDYYNRETKNLLTNLALPQVSGFSSVLTNLGTLQNRGIEIEVDANIIESNDFTWNAGFNISHNENKILKLPENGNENNRIGGYLVADPKTGEDIWVGGLQEGQTIGDIYSYQVLGVYATTEEAYAGPTDQLVPGTDKRKVGGDNIFLDVNKDGTIDTKDRVYMGNAYPDWTGGFTNTFSYKNLSLTIRTDFALGHTIRNRQAATYMGQWQGDIGILSDVKNSWKQEGDETNVPRYYWADQLAQNNTYRNGGGDLAMNSDFHEKGDYLALREITLSYNMPKLSILKKAGISSLRVYGTASNLGYLTSYSGLLPEDGGWDNGRYPNPKSFLFGLNLSF